jgi:peroxiredoxin
MNQNNKKTPWVPILIITLAVLALGYFLFKSSPRNANNQTAGDSMHGGSSDSTALNSWVGKAMPSIQLTDKDGKTYTADSFKGKTTVLFFNEGLMCYPACWNQIAQFGTDQRFNTDQVQAISVVVDSASEWQKAISKMPDLAKAATLFDKGGDASRSLGLLSLPSSMHKGSLPGHTYVVLDKDGIVRYVSDDPNMAIANDTLIKKIAEFN